MMDWFPAVMTLVGVLVGMGVQEFRIWREKKDKYKDMVFEKRLDAHQGAYYWVTRLLKLMVPPKLMKDGGAEVAFKETEKANEWLDKNALYLDENSRIKMLNFIIYIHETLRKYEDEEGRSNINIKAETMELYEKSGDLLSNIERGIGVKYLHKQKTSENIEVQKLLDKAVERMEESVRK